MLSGPLDSLRRSTAVALVAFGVVMLACVAAFGSLIAVTTEKAAEQTGLETAAAVRRGDLEAAVWSVLDPSDLAAPLSVDTMAALDRAVRTAFRSREAAAGSTLTDLDGVVVWSGGPNAIEPTSNAGNATATLVSDTNTNAVRYVLPLRSEGEPIAVLTAVVDDPDVFASVGGGSTRVVVLVVSAMAALWLAALALAKRVLRRGKIESEMHRKIALVDPLTGLANRAALTERGDAAIANSSRIGTKVGLVIIDLDQFKAVNDTGGHALGDKVLIEVGRRLLKITRSGELVLRVGGDEFAVLIPTLNRRNDLEALAHRIRLALNITVKFDTASDVHVSASVGVASAPRDGDSIGKLFRTADAQMYSEKSKLHSRSSAASASKISATS